MFKIDFGKLGRPYDAMRRELAEGFTVEVDGKKIPGTCKRWYTRAVRGLRERNRKRDRVNKVAHKLIREPAILVI